MKSGERFWFTAAELQRQLPGPSGERFAVALERDEVSVELYAPRGTDPQVPHTRDEIYVVVSGRGEFVNGATRHAFGPGDVMFVPAGAEHRFEQFDDDLAVWAIFFGPEGGDAA
jgi:mannose-6-phosphate isomerase-like protein (cupin superfamily)